MKTYLNGYSNMSQRIPQRMSQRHASTHVSTHVSTLVQHMCNAVLFDLDDLDNIAQKRRASQVNQSEVSAMLGEHRMLALIRGRHTSTHMPTSILGERGVDGLVWSDALRLSGPSTR